MKAKFLQPKRIRTPPVSKKSSFTFLSVSGILQRNLSYNMCLISNILSSYEEVLKTLNKSVPRTETCKMVTPYIAFHLRLCIISAIYIIQF
jgi:hypothetical protein